MFENNGVPLYIQLKYKLLRIIETTYKPNDLLPPESKLLKTYKVSRITVRKAMEELEREGIIVKKQGLGTFVREKKILYDANSIGSLTQRLAKQNHSLQTETLEYEIITSRHYVKELLKCDTLVLIKRFRVLDGTPFALMKNYIDIKKAPNLQKNFKIESLYTFLKKEYNIEFYSAEETVEARAATKEEAKILEIKEAAPLLLLHRLSFDKDNDPVEFSDIVIKSDMYKHKIMLSRGKGL
ncbi:MAG: GntR family transcriptional regulator [Epsilonproteobacteria bacterium]|nr:GntR family transcriptional regulator [Campylobacterota bacterium]